MEFNGYMIVTLLGLLCLWHEKTVANYLIVLSSAVCALYHNQTIHLKGVSVKDFTEDDKTNAMILTIALLTMFATMIVDLILTLKRKWNKND